MLYRTINKKIESFFETDKKALLIDGARQTGKTFTIRLIGSQCFENIVEINFVRQPDAVQIINNAKGSEDLLLRLSLFAGKKMVPGKTLIFFDEIQECPEIVTAIKFLVPVPANSVVIALAGQGKTRGTVAINEIELCTNQSLCAIVPSSEVHFEYLFHNLRGRYMELRGMAGDVNGRGGLNLKIVNSIKIILPPIEEQLKFVKIAEQADKSKFELQKSINEIESVIKSLINNYHRKSVTPA